MKQRQPLLELLCILLFVLLIILLASSGKAVDASISYKEDKSAAHEVAELLRSKGYPEDNPVIVAAKEWWHSADDQQMAHYPAAGEVWKALTAAGLSEPVVAGILGNMMAECGGNSLSLIPDLYCGQYYGLCMWDLGYTPQVDGLDVAGQCAVLLDTMERNIEEAGGSYERFIAMTDTRQAARYFDKYYERSAGLATYQRGENAVAALSWFGG